MKAIIVGHGPSMLVEPMGHLIDEHDKVIRLKRCQDTLTQPDHYGTRTDIVGGSLTIAAHLRGIGGAREYWVFTDSRHEDTPQDTLASVPFLFRGNECILDDDLCRQWDTRYRALRDEMGGPGHNHTSQGFKAIIYACHHLAPEELVLVGFDNVMTGRFTWSITRGPEWQHYPDHRWDVEHKLLEQVQSDYPDTQIGWLLPDEPMKEKP